MTPGKITLTKQTEINGEVKYFVYDAEGWCMGCSLDYEKAKGIYETCVKNFENGGKKEVVIMTHP